MRHARTLLLAAIVGMVQALVAVIALAASASHPNAAPVVLIDRVHYDGYSLQDMDEAIRLRNTGESAVALDGWRLSDGSNDGTVISAGVVLQTGQAIWLARDAVEFRTHFGESPDVIVTPWPGFANSGDEVLLYDSAGALVDAVVYGDGDTSHTGWTGEAVQPYRVTAVFGVEGQILYRRQDPDTGAPAADTDQAADWAQWTGDPVNGRKVMYPGWQLDRFYLPEQIATTGTITLAIAPDNSYTAIRSLIDSARERIRLASLTFENIALGEALAAAAYRGVDVDLLLEGGPPGGISDQEREICKIIEYAGGACWFMVSDDARRIHARYRFMHAKYLIVDDRQVMISTENFSPDSMPDDDKADGTWGRRGVILILESKEAAEYIGTLFADDLDQAHADILRWSPNHPTHGLPPPGFVPIRETGGISYTVRYPEPVAFAGPYSLVISHSPENSLREKDGLLGLLAQARAGDRILMQALTERPYWGSTTSNRLADPNPRLEAAIAAARRGADVRLLLDAFFDDSPSAVSNAATCREIEALRLAESLPIHCVQSNPTGLGIHNKMALAWVGGRGYAHIGSVNGTELANKGNRELSVLVQSDAVYDYLAEVFERDVPHVAYAPLVGTGMAGPVNRLLISEFAYDTAGTDDAEFVEIVNPTSAAVDLATYTLGDAVRYDDFEDVRVFPPGAIILPRQTMVVAVSAVAFHEQFGGWPDFEIVDSDPNIPDMVDEPGWGSPEALFRLGNQGDEVILRRGLEVVDVVAYGLGDFPGVVACPLLVAPNRVLERLPYWLDSDDCLVDFRAWPFASPGRLP